MKTMILVAGRNPASRRWPDWPRSEAVAVHERWILTAVDTKMNQLDWLASYDRVTGELSVYAARECGYGDMLRRGYVENRGPDAMPDLFITAAGIRVVKDELDAWYRERDYEEMDEFRKP